MNRYAPRWMWGQSRGSGATICSGTPSAQTTSYTDHDQNLVTLLPAGSCSMRSEHFDKTTWAVLRVTPTVSQSALSFQQALLTTEKEYQGGSLRPHLLTTCVDHLWGIVEHIFTLILKLGSVQQLLKTPSMALCQTPYSLRTSISNRPLALILLLTKTL